MKMRAPAVALLIVATATSLTMLGGPASAAPTAPKKGAASVGAVSVTLDGVATNQASIAPCTTLGANSTPGTTPVAGVVYGKAETSCTRDKGEATAVASGKRFKVTVLRRHRGPVIALTSWSVQCSTKKTGSTASMTLSGLTGVTVPSNIPVNYTVTVPGHKPSDPVLAKVVFNELVVPSPPDGSMVMNLMHIKLFPNTPNSPDRGDIVLGTVDCDPNK
ncbi:hypothetical protein [Labedaea rhizosphaerae]|uniref:Uncharacterized protein n=1 Tax=Labedaea rhizosphaerae TaxID=598644 RepID=A0A4R6SAK7_LABRH|nr:hypothetical protein [Labedaea rhizosphaerae]TDP96553.1 hypothetical protein EV186_104541 [Labedaea rhizosphaerae]